MEHKDIRWQQRFANFNKAFSQLQNAVARQNYNELERQGLIKAFEFTYELAWNTVRDFLRDKGYIDLIGSKDTLRLAFQTGLIDDGEVWMNMVTSRNLTAHTYNQDTAEEIEKAILHIYYPALKDLQQRLVTEITDK